VRIGKDAREIELAANEFSGLAHEVMKLNG
jgi:hypothetical protein